MNKSKMAGIIKALACLGAGTGASVCAVRLTQDGVLKAFNDGFGKGVLATVGQSFVGTMAYTGAFLCVAERVFKNEIAEFYK